MASEELDYSTVEDVNGGFTVYFRYFGACKIQTSVVYLELFVAFVFH